MRQILLESNCNASLPLEVMERKQIETILQEALRIGQAETSRGSVASYIPALAHADPSRLGISLFAKNGARYEVGDTDIRFTIQSISKVISLAVALEVCSSAQIFSKVGMEPSGNAFNSLEKLDLDNNRPFNPMINAGAITVASCLAPRLSFEKLLSIARQLCLDPDITLDESVCQSELGTLARNRAIAYLLQSKGIIEGDVEESLGFYVRLCSLRVTANSLAGLGLVLALGGKDPRTGQRLLESSVVRTVKTMMLTCGMYDGSGEFAVRVGIPTKSGVGGGLLSVADRRLGIGIYGPALDGKGNSIAGCRALEYLSDRLHLHLFSETSVQEEPPCTQSSSISSATGSTAIS